MGNKNNKPTYISTFQDSYLKPTPSKEGTIAAHDSAEKSNSKMGKVAQFSYGKDAPNYQSI